MTLDEASRILATSGTRLIELDDTGVPTIGIWSDLDCEAIRLALFCFGSGACPVKYLDGPGVPPRFQLRRVPGDPVPMNVLNRMLADTRASATPWRVRDRMLAKVNYHSQPIPFPVLWKLK